MLLLRELPDLQRGRSYGMTSRVEEAFRSNISHFSLSKLCTHSPQKHCDLRVPLPFSLRRVTAEAKASRRRSRPRSRWRWWWRDRGTSQPATSRSLKLRREIRGSSRLFVWLPAPKMQDGEREEWRETGRIKVFFFYKTGFSFLSRTA